MNPNNQAELDQIRRQVSKLRLDLQTLEERVDVLEARGREPAPAAPLAVSIPALSDAAFVIPEPAPVDVLRTQATSVAEPLQPPIPSLTTPMDIPPLLASTHAPSNEPAPRAVESHLPAAAPQQDEAESLEARIGEYWFVRVGVVMLLTALIFFGNYAYQRFAGLLGPGAKLAGMAAVSLGLAYAGRSLTRREGALQNYGQVLLAGGLGGVYLTLYAAHFFPALRVIDNLPAAVGLLMCWAGFVVWLADKLRFSVMAGFALGLAYYTNALQPAAWMSLLGNAVVSAAAWMLVMRRGWRMFSAFSLAASYAGYAYWRFRGDDGDPSVGGLSWLGLGFLVSYWVLFSAGALLPRISSAKDSFRTRLCVVNNAAFLILASLDLHKLQPERFWILPAVMGAVFFGISSWVRSRFQDEPGLSSSFVMQSILAWIWAAGAGLSGAPLALAYGAGAVTMVCLAAAQEDRLLRLFGRVLCVLSLMTGCAGLVSLSQGKGLALGLGTAAMHALGALWLHRFQARGGSGPRLEVRVLTLLAGWFCLFATGAHLDGVQMGMALALEALALLGLAWWSAFRGMALAGHGLLAASTLPWTFVGMGYPDGGASLFVVIAVPFAVAHLANWDRFQVIGSSAARFVTWLHSCAAVWSLFLWIHRVPEAQFPLWVWMDAGLAMAFVAYGVWRRIWAIAFAGQGFLWAANILFVRSLIEGSESQGRLLVPLAVTWFTGWLAQRFATAESTDLSDRIRRTLALAGGAYRSIAGGMLVAWVWCCVPNPYRALVLTGVGGALLLIPTAVADVRRFVWTVVFCELGWISATAAPSVLELVSGWDLAALGLFLAQRAAVSAWPSRYSHPRAWLTISSVQAWVGLWIWIARWVAQSGSGFYQTAVWGIYAGAVIGAGLFMRDVAGRRTGLAILAASLGRVFFVDVWTLDPVPRMLGFAALGGVLIGLGFVYTRFKHQIRRWL